MEYHLNMPLKDEDIIKLNIGDVVYFSGAAFTGRSRLHRHIFDEENRLPFETENRNLMIHVGPIVIKEKGLWKLNSFTPTSSIRFEKWGAQSITEWHLKAIIGKTTMREQTMRAMKEHLCIHATPMGVIPNLYLDKIEIEDVHLFEELGSIEAAWILRVDDLGPFLVDIDTKGRNYFDELDSDLNENRKKAYRRLGIGEDFEYTRLY
jgi:tartrate/fumarate subfamily iron-sulfur-dependent hydro-lyase beta chain